MIVIGLFIIAGLIFSDAWEPVDDPLLTTELECVHGTLISHGRPCGHGCRVKTKSGRDGLANFNTRGM